MGKLRITLEIVKIEHTVFALPFAFLGAVFAAEGIPRPAQIGWIVAAMVGARSAAMAFNRLVDLPFDARNPRTASRALPSGLLSRAFVAGFVLVSSALFVFAAAMLNPLAFALSPVALVTVFFYSFTKRFTWLSHFVLGISLGLAPAGAWIAVRGSIKLLPLLLGLSVMLWVAGLDIIYACQDLEFDRREALFSVPRRFGLSGALWISAALHLVMLLLLAGIFYQQRLGVLAFAGLGVVGLLLAWEHSIVKPSDLSGANTAFFTINGCISVLLFVTTAVDIVLHKGS